MKNSEIFKDIYSKMEKEHLNLYHDISKEEVENYIQNLPNLDELSDIDFDYEMLKFFAIFKDAHTIYYIPAGPIDKEVIFLENKFWVLDNGTYKEIANFGNLLSHDFFNKLEKIANYETQECLADKIRIMLKNRRIYRMLKANDGEQVVLQIKNDKPVVVNFPQNPTPLTAETFYSYKLLDNNILYIRYRKCMNMPDYPFVDFAKNLQKEIECNNIQNYILDLRDNHGGYSAVVEPLINLVHEKSLQGVLLIDNGVFSGGRYAVADFKYNFGTPLIGEATGGAAKSYGNCKWMESGDKHFSVSTALHNLSEKVGCAGAIPPDIYVPKTISNMQNQIDRPLDCALQYLQNKNLIIEK